MAPPPLLDPIREAFAEERVADAPLRVWRDWALIAVLLGTALLEVLHIRSDLGWPIPSFIVCVATMPTLLWRRTHPLAMLAIALGAFNVLSISAWLAGTEHLAGLYTGAFVVILFYSVFRWGPGSEFPLALGIMAVSVLINTIIDFTGFGDLIGGLIVALVPIELGALVRYRNTAQVRRVDEIRLREREQLARELHDTVAHHVSAIAVQAQAGLVAAKADPAARALSAIEEEASRTLTELRLMVGALRDSDDAEFAPQLGLANIDELALSGSGTPQIDIELVGELDELRPAVQAAVYRLTQESITNARRHARDATQVLVRIVGRGDSVELTVRDDGSPGGGSRNGGGYGLTGMTERARLLGGSLDAGPAPGGGWLVSATLPTS